MNMWKKKLKKIIKILKGVSIGKFSDTLFFECELYKSVSSNVKDKTPYDLSKEKALINDLFANDKEVNRLVLIQELRHAVLSNKD